MAHIGLERFYYAPLRTNASAADMEQEKHEGNLLYQAYGVIKGARRADVTYNRADGALYGDDKLAEHWDMTMSADIDIEWAPRTDVFHATDDDGSEDIDMYMLGIENRELEDDGALLSLRTENEKWVGFGFIRVMLVNGVKVFRAVKFFKVLFHLATEETQTREEQIQWGCPILRGHAVPVELYPTTAVPQGPKMMIRDYQDFETLALADQWLKTQFPTEPEIGVDIADDT